MQLRMSLAAIMNPNDTTTPAADVLKEMQFKDIENMNRKEHLAEAAHQLYQDILPELLKIGLHQSDYQKVKAVLAAFYGQDK